MLKKDLTVGNHYAYKTNTYSLSAARVKLLELRPGPWARVEKVNGTTGNPIEGFEGGFLLNIRYLRSTWEDYYAANQEHLDRLKAKQAAAEQQQFEKGRLERVVNKYNGRLSEAGLHGIVIALRSIGDISNPEFIFRLQGEDVATYVVDTLIKEVH